MKARAKRDRARIALGAASLVAVALVFALDLEDPLPGPVAAVHARAGALDGGERCELCHGGGGATLGDACLACHTAIADDLAAGTGLHGALPAEPRACGRCHLEHLGAEAPLVGARSFALAGVGSRADFDHGPLGFPLAGVHRALDCARCHAHADAVVLPEGARRFAGLAQDCGSCHADAHGGRMTRACADCHAQERPFPLVAAYRHASFASECAHASASCADCHARSGAHAVERASAAPLAERACGDCHVAPHAPAFVAGVAVLAGLAEERSCALCHADAHGTFAGHADAMAPALHAASGFELSAPHDGLACLACHREVHGDEVVDFAPRGRGADDCAACHADPHGGQFAADGATRCAACHARTEFVPAAFGLEQHAHTGFALEGGHAAVACARCHAPELAELPRRFRDTPRACAECHADPHAGAFDRADVPATLDGQVGCARCHVVDGFARVERARFDHDWTGYALAREHRDVACEQCHAPGADAAAPGGARRDLGRAPGRDCADCHGDPHAGQFECRTPADCARCHSERGALLFDHARTRFPLRGKHAELDCATCHVPWPVADGRTIVRYRPLGSTCGDCHAPGSVDERSAR